MVSGPLCLCGRSVFESNTSCTVCLEQQAIRHSRRSQRTPPPDQLQRRNNSVNTTLSSAFASRDLQPTWLPANVYRTPARSLSRNRRTPGGSEAGSPVLTPTRGSIDGRTTPSRGSIDGRISHTDIGPRNDRAYSPMSAGFARLNLQDPQGSPQQRSRSRPGSRHVEFDLSARMFAGAA